MTELKSSIDLELQIHKYQDKLKDLLTHKQVVSDQMAELRREKIAYKSQINDIDIKLSSLSQGIAMARDNITRLQIDIKQTTDAFWAAKKDGR